MVLSCQSEPLNHHSSTIITTTLQVKIVICLPRLWSVYWRKFIKAIFYCFSQVFRKQSGDWCCNIKNKSHVSCCTDFSYSTLPVSVRFTSSKQQISSDPTLSLAATGFWLKVMFCSHSFTISASLSSAKHKFMAHSCTDCGFLLLHQEGITTVLFRSLKCGVTATESKLSPFSQWPDKVIHKRQVHFGTSPVCSFCSVQGVHYERINSYESVLRMVFEVNVFISSTNMITETFFFMCRGLAGITIYDN